MSKFKIALHKYIVQTPHSHNPKLNFNFRIMETDDISELEVDNELIAMISGEFENTSDVAERPRRPSREQRSVESLEEEETGELEVRACPQRPREHEGFRCRPALVQPQLG